MKKFYLIILIVGLSLSFYSCNDDDNNNGGTTPPVVGETFFISAVGESSEYILQTQRIDSGEINIRPNVKELENSGYTWIFNTNPSVAIGLIYVQGDPGIGLGYGVDADSTLKELGQFLIPSRFTSYGFFENYALTSVGGQTIVKDGSTLTHEDGTERIDGVTFNFINTTTLSSTQKTIETLNITGNGDQATFSGIVDMGNGEFLTGLVVSQPIDESATGGSSSGTVNYPDSVWIAAFDANLNLKRIYRDDRISYSSGRYRSQYYSQIGKTDDGTVYVFSGSYDSNTTRPCGALKIAKGGTEFDQNYYFNIEAKSDGYRFRKVWYIKDDYFLLEFYNEAGPITTTLAPATQYGIVNMAGEGSFQWISGLPDKDNITDTGLPYSYNGKMYFPITETTQKNPSIYVIDPITATATRGLSITGASTIRAVGRLTE
ncbi:MAG: DUF4374 domain-containing protein [Odoribacter sp.]|nr:DUF4374 domain-containing protein [Odoribacter sp.]